MKLAIQRIYFSLLAGEFVVPDLKPLTTSWLQSRRLAAPNRPYKPSFLST